VEPSLGSPNALAVLDRYPVGFLGVDLQAEYTVEGHETFLGILGYISAIKGMGLSLTSSLTAAARSITPCRDNGILGAFGSYFLCKFDRFTYSSAIALAASSVGDRGGDLSSHSSYS